MGTHASTSIAVPVNRSPCSALCRPQIKRSRRALLLVLEHLLLLNTEHAASCCSSREEVLLAHAFQGVRRQQLQRTDTANCRQRYQTIGVTVCARNQDLHKGRGAAPPWHHQQLQQYTAVCTVTEQVHTCTHTYFYGKH